MEKGTVRFALYTMAFFAIVIAVHAMRYEAVPFNVFIGVDNDIRAVIARAPVQALTHMLIGPIALMTGPWQFFAGLRTKHPRFHRWNGRVYIVACLISGMGALFTAPFASGGIVATIGFALLALSWLGTTFVAWRLAVARKFASHRILMRFSYALTFAAVTLRLQVPVGLIFLGFASYREMSVWLAYTCWIPNVIAVGLYTLASVSPGRRESQVAV